MARTARAAVGGVCYHVLNRGNDRKVIFRQPGDFDDFLRIAALARARDPIEVFAYCLMPNHFHFVVRPGGSRTLSRWVHWMLSTHAVAHRRCYKTAGHLWQGRFRAFPIEDDHHLLTVIRYVERNALRANLVARAEDWRWGSLNERLGFRPRGLLDDAPCAVPGDWCSLVNAREADSELRDLRACIGTGRPFASDEWIRKAEATRGARFDCRPRGRPKKSEHAGSPGARSEQDSLFD